MQITVGANTCAGSVRLTGCLSDDQHLLDGLARDANTSRKFAKDQYPFPNAAVRAR
jgi:hypothetical protein